METENNVIHRNLEFSGIRGYLHLISSLNYRLGQTVVVVVVLNLISLNHSFNLFLEICTCFLPLIIVFIIRLEKKRNSSILFKLIGSELLILKDEKLISQSQISNLLVTERSGEAIQVFPSSNRTQKYFLIMTKSNFEKVEAVEKFKKYIQVQNGTSFNWLDHTINGLFVLILFFVSLIYLNDLNAFKLNQPILTIAFFGLISTVAALLVSVYYQLWKKYYFNRA